MDLILTIPIALQPFVAPRSTHLLFAIGNTITCEWTGFFFNFCLGGIFMNAALSLYYMLMVTYNKSEAVIQQWLEPTVYIGALGLPTVFGIVGIIYKSFNPNLLLSACELAPYPADCTVLDSVDCIRGGTTAVWTKLAHSALYAILAGTGIYCTLRVFWTVRTKTHTTLQYTSDATEHAHKNARQLQRIRAVGTQAMLYCGAFVNGFWVILLTEIVNFYYLRQLQSSQDDTADLSQESWAFPVTLLAYLFWPLQGCTSSVQETGVFFDCVSSIVLLSRLFCPQSSIAASSCDRKSYNCEKSFRNDPFCGPVAESFLLPRILQMMNFILSRPRPIPNYNTPIHTFAGQSRLLSSIHHRQATRMASRQDCHHSRTHKSKFHPSTAIVQGGQSRTCSESHQYPWQNKKTTIFRWHRVVSRNKVLRKNFRPKRIVPRSYCRTL